MRKIRILMVCNLLDIGGTEKALQTFCKYLDRSRFEVIACGRLGGGCRVDALRGLGILVVVGPVNLNELVNKLKIDICHVYRSDHYEEGSLPEKPNGWPRIVETSIFHDFDPVEGEKIDCHLFMSEFSRNQYRYQRGENPGSKYNVLYNPIDFEEFPLAEKPFSYTIGRCSRADDAKWHKVCVNALPKIFRKFPQTLCLFQGATVKVREHLASLGMENKIQFSEPSLNVRDFYRKLDIFTHGARVGETFGCVIAEAMANRIPVVTISTPRRKKANAQAELVEHNVTGFVCRFSWQYANAVIELLKNHDLRQRFAKRGYEKAREEFDAARLTRKLETVYCELMETIV